MEYLWNCSISFINFSIQLEVYFKYNSVHDTCVSIHESYCWCNYWHWHWSHYLYYRSSSPEVFLGKGALKICSKFAGEHPCLSVISIKLLNQLNCSTWLFYYKSNWGFIWKYKRLDTRKSDNGDLMISYQSDHLENPSQLHMIGFLSNRLSAIVLCITKRKPLRNYEECF